MNNELKNPYEAYGLANPYEAYGLSGPNDF